MQVEWNNPSDPSKGFKYLYLTDADYSSINARADTAVLKAEPFFAQSGELHLPTADSSVLCAYEDTKIAVSKGIPLISLQL